MEASQHARFEEAKKFIQELFSAVTDKSLPQLKLHLKSLEKELANKDAQAANESTSGSLLSQYCSVSELLNHTLDGKSKSALHFACARGDPEVVRLLVEEYKADPHLKDSEKYTPFFTAVQHGHLPLVRYFVEELKQPVNTTVDGNISALHVSANSGFCDIVQYLVDRGADKELLSVYGRPLNWAVGSNRTDASLLLLDLGADPNGDLSGPFPAPIILAVDFGNCVLYQRLIDRGADLSVKDPKGYSLLHLASEKGNLELVQFLIAKGLDVAYKAEGKTCLYLAFENLKYDVVEYLKTVIDQSQCAAIEQEVKHQNKKLE